MELTNTSPEKVTSECKAAETRDCTDINPDVRGLPVLVPVKCPICPYYHYARPEDLS